MSPEPIILEAGSQGPRLLFVEPYLNASHRALAQGLMARYPARWTLLGLPGRHFRWRMRGAAAFLATAASELLARPWDGLVVSSMLGLAELKGLAPALAGAPALVYFHENQLAYPAPGRAGAAHEARDLYLALSNLTSSLAAEAVAFNSAYHRDQVLHAAAELIPRLPDARPPGLVGAIAAKASVLPVPIDPGEAEGLAREARSGPLRILWNHRWSDDKDPEVFFAALDGLAARGLDFVVAVLGLRPGRYPGVFDRARGSLGPRLVHWGPVEDRREYWRWLYWADLAVSCARQEYQGLALLEAARAGCRPLVPDDLVYPELYPAECRYPRGGLKEALVELAAAPEMARGEEWSRLAAGHTWEALYPPWAAALDSLVGQAGG